ncbi:hypothetical protein GCM10009740_16090 [Terrabacter terrae]|uniref:Uncharacterized protein n=1 Tax=Terrabacter terrae TaxID=318434 RepID=A0ABN2U191_9MICO
MVYPFTYLAHQGTRGGAESCHHHESTPRRTAGAGKPPPDVLTDVLGVKPVLTHRPGHNLRPEPDS